MPKKNQKYNKSINTLEKIWNFYTWKPLKDDLFKFRCWFYYILFILSIPIIGNGIIFLMISGVNLKNGQEFVIMFTVCLIVVVWWTTSWFLNNWILKLEQKTIFINNKKYLWIFGLLLNFWTIIFINRVKKNYRRN